MKKFPIYWMQILLVINAMSIIVYSKEGRSVKGLAYLKIIGSRMIGKNGGVVTNSAGDIVVTVAPGSVTGANDINVSIIRGRDALGRVVIKVITHGQPNLLVNIQLPNPNVLDANTPRTNQKNNGLIH